MELDQVFRGFAVSQGAAGTMIACLYTGYEPPSYCAPMPRDPSPPVGALLNNNFHIYVSDAITLNPSVHDGAIMIGRETTDDAYKITGWSFRLFAPNCGGHPPANRGSAFNSCFALAQEGRIDRVYLYSSGQMHLFTKRTHKLIYDGSKQ